MSTAIQFTLSEETRTVLNDIANRMLEMAGEHEEAVDPGVRIALQAEQKILQQNANNMVRMASGSFRTQDDAEQFAVRLVKSLNHEVQLGTSGAKAMDDVFQAAGAAESEALRARLTSDITRAAGEAGIDINAPLKTRGGVAAK